MSWENVNFTNFRHPYISKEERDLIEVSLGKRLLMPSLNPDTSSKEDIHSEIDEPGMVENDNLPIISMSNNTSESLPIPYKAIFTSLPVYGLLIANIAQGYGFYTLLSEIPTYMSQILHFDIKEVWPFVLNVFKEDISIEGHSRFEIWIILSSRMLFYQLFHTSACGFVLFLVVILLITLEPKVFGLPPKLARLWI